MRKQQPPVEVRVIDYARHYGEWSKPAAIPHVNSPRYVARKTKRQKAIDRAERRKLNRKRWHLIHEVELNETKRLLFKALRLLRRNKVKMPTEMADVLAMHERWRPCRVGGRRYKKVHKFES